MLNIFKKSLIKHIVLTIFFLIVMRYYFNNERSFALVIMLFSFFSIGLIMKVSNKFFFFLSILALIATPIAIQINQNFILKNEQIPEKVAKIIYLFIILGLMTELSKNKIIINMSTKLKQLTKKLLSSFL